MAVKILNSNYGVSSTIKGKFKIVLPHKKHISILFSRLGFSKKVKEIEVLDTQDSIEIAMMLMPANTITDTVSIYGTISQIP